jgi:pyruvate ferredoxin oxidoreductase beta subunit
MNTGIQRSGLTPTTTNTTTTPPGSGSIGNPRPKKPMPEIVAAHGIPYVATASVGYPQDIQKKVKKALSIKGPKYIQIHVPCPLGWRHEPGLTFDVAKLAVETGMYPIFEYDNGQLVGRKIAKIKPVEEYVKVQGRFKHLMKDPVALKQLQDVADSNIKKYNLKMEASA